MKEININTLISQNFQLNENIPNDIIIVGKIENLWIIYKYNQLNLSDVECGGIYYINQEEESIKNHILPNSLQILNFPYNQLKSLPNLPNSLKELHCYSNKLTSLPDLPNSLIFLDCDNNNLTLLPDLPNYLEVLYCSNNQLILLPDLSNSLQSLYCQNNKLKLIPEFKNKIEIYFYQDENIEYIPYTNNIQLKKYCYKNKINIIDYPYNPITNQEELDKYMNYQLQFIQNRKKSAKK